MMIVHFFGISSSNQIFYINARNALLNVKPTFVKSSVEILHESEHLSFFILFTEVFNIVGSRHLLCPGNEERAVR